MKDYAKRIFELANDSIMSEEQRINSIEQVLEIVMVKGEHKRASEEREIRLNTLNCKIRKQA